MDSGAGASHTSQPIRSGDPNRAVSDATRTEDAASSSEDQVSVHYGGRCYLTSRAHAAIFLRNALGVAKRHETELVVLAHRDGVDLLLITDAMPLPLAGATASCSARDRARCADELATADGTRGIVAAPGLHVGLECCAVHRTHALGRRRECAA